MPRCRDGGWCIDDLCHMVSETLCGVDLDNDRGPDGDYPAEEDEDTWEDDRPWWVTG